MDKENVEHSFLLWFTQMFRLHVDQREIEHLVEQQSGQGFELVGIDGGLGSNLVRLMLGNSDLGLIENVHVVQHFRRLLVVLMKLFVQLFQFHQIGFQLIVLLQLFVSYQFQCFEAGQRPRNFLERKESTSGENVRGELTVKYLFFSSVSC